MLIFNIKKEDKRRKARLVISVRVVDTSTLPAYSYVI